MGDLLQASLRQACFLSPCGRRELRLVEDELNGWRPKVGEN